MVFEFGFQHEYVCVVPFDKWMLHPVCPPALRAPVTRSGSRKQRKADTNQENMNSFPFVGFQ